MMRLLRMARASVLRDLHGDAALARLSEEWRKLAASPHIVRDLIELGQIYEPSLDPKTGELPGHDEMIARAVRRDFALTLLNRAELGHDELTQVLADFDRSDFNTQEQTHEHTDFD